MANEAIGCLTNRETLLLQQGENDQHKHLRKFFGLSSNRLRQAIWLYDFNQSHVTLPLAQ